MGAIFVTILNKTMKHIIQRPRPEDIEHLVQEGGYSFPSGHTITSMFVYGMLLYLIWIHVKNRRLRNILSVLVMIPLVLVGPSRIYLGVHYPTDVLAGWCPIRSIDGSHWGDAADNSRTREKIFTKIFAENFAEKQ